MKQSPKRLALRKEAVRVLKPVELERAAGGAGAVANATDIYTVCPTTHSGFAPEG